MGKTPDLGTWLRAQRLARGWDVHEMARRLHRAAADDGGATPVLHSVTTYVYNWEDGTTPGHTWKTRICAALGITEGDWPQPAAAPPPPAGDLLFVAEVATMLRVSKMTVYRLIKDGTLEATKIGKRSYRVKGESARRAAADGTGPVNDG
jgi:excisionase family DNA binding protein